MMMIERDDAVGRDQGAGRDPGRNDGFYSKYRDATKTEWVK